MFCAIAFNVRSWYVSHPWFMLLSFSLFWSIVSFSTKKTPIWTHWCHHLNAKEIAEAHCWSILWIWLSIDHFYACNEWKFIWRHVFLCELHQIMRLDKPNWKWPIHQSTGHHEFTTRAVTHITNGNLYIKRREITLHGIFVSKSISIQYDAHSHIGNKTISVDEWSIIPNLIGFDTYNKQPNDFPCPFESFRCGCNGEVSNFKSIININYSISIKLVSDKEHIQPDSLLCMPCIV